MTLPLNYNVEDNMTNTAREKKLASKGIIYDSMRCQFVYSITIIITDAQVKIAYTYKEDEALLVSSYFFETSFFLRYTQYKFRKHDMREREVREIGNKR